MEHSPQQLEALDKVEAWYGDPFSQVFRLFGYAGTGKTTLAKSFAERDKDRQVVFAAFTGKAAHVLRTKGCSASTIHSLTYRLVSEKNKKPVFELDDKSILKSTDLLVLDEVSMVNEEIGQDLLSFGCKVLVLGDPAQLPPVSGTGFFTEAPPDFLLTEVHRQAADSPIIKLATSIRNGMAPMPGNYGDSTVQFGMTKDLVMNADQLLVGKNATRKLSNSRARQIKGFLDPLPMVGDKLVCLRNSRQEGLMNGTTWKVTAVDTEWIGDPDQFFEPAFRCDIKSDDMDVELFGVQMHKEHFLGTFNEVRPSDIRRANEFDFGYALTCHKAQGSQWDHVVIADESGVFRENKWRWLYTAVTRAAKRVNICKV